MDVIVPSRPLRRTPIVPLVGGTLFSTLFIVGGLALAYLAFATPFLTLALPSGHPDVAQTVIGITIWAVALVAPAGLVLAGANRLARNLATARGRAPRRSMTLKALDDLPDDITVATGLTLPDGRGVSELVLGPFGAAVVRELPPAGATRIRGENWQLRTSRGWIQLENPLERAVARRRARPPLADRRRRFPREGLLRRGRACPDHRPHAALRGPGARPAGRLDLRPAGPAQHDPGPPPAGPRHGAHRRSLKAPAPFRGATHAARAASPIGNIRTHPGVRTPRLTTRWGSSPVG